MTRGALWPIPRATRLAHALGVSRAMFREGLAKHAPAQTFYHRLNRMQTLDRAFRAEVRRER